MLISMPFHLDLHHYHHLIKNPHPLSLDDNPSNTSLSGHEDHFVL